MLDNTLINCMESLRREYTKETETLFYQQLKQAKFLCPVILKEENHVKLIYYIDSTGKKYLPAYTDNESYNNRKATEEERAVVFDLHDYYKIMSSDESIFGVAINPYSQNMILERKNVLWSMEENSTIQKNEEISIGIPKDYPVELVDRLKKYFVSIPQIRSAYLLWMVRQNEASYLLVLETKDKPEVLFPKISKECQPYISGKILDILPLGSSFSKKAIEGQTPFYVKS